MSDATTTKEWPIIFSAPMVRAILRGRKTETRRIDRRSNRWGHLEPGDRLWVREGWQVDPSSVQGAREQHEHIMRARPILFYRADEEICHPGAGWVWRSPMLMPRWASRITLGVTQTPHAEYLQDITDGAAISEGFDSREQFKALWCDRHGADAWERNPFVWVVRFRRINDSEVKF